MTAGEVAGAGERATAPHPALGLRTAPRPPQVALTDRDVEILRFVVRHGMVTAEQLGGRFFSSMPATWRRIRLLEAIRLLQRDRIWMGLPLVVRATEAGLRLADCDLPRSPLDRASLRHDLAVVDLSEELLAEHEGAAWLTERELRRDRMRAARESARERQRRVPDGLLMLPSGERLAVELDLTPKRSARLDQLASAYATDSEVTHVWWYLPSDAAAGRMREIVERRGLGHLIEPRVRRVDRLL